jgi:hypothetical protein
MGGRGGVRKWLILRDFKVNGVMDFLTAAAALPVLRYAFAGLHRYESRGFVLNSSI